MAKSWKLKGPRRETLDRKHVNVGDQIVTFKFCTNGQHWVDELFFNKNKNNPDGLRKHCRACDRLNYLKEADRYRFNAIKRRYGIEKETYLEMIEEQNNICPICEEILPSDTKHVHVDHCHATEKIRGILCSKCNTTLGRFNDSIRVLENAIAYLKGDM